MTATSLSTLVILTSTFPTFKCIIHIPNEFTSFSICSLPSSKSNKPDIKSLEILSYDYSNSATQKEDEIIYKLFQKNDLSDDGNGLPNKIADILFSANQDRHQDKSREELLERLEEAAEGTSSSSTSSSDSKITAMEEFLKRSESVFEELLAVIQQRRLVKERKEKQGHESYSVSYYSALLMQLNSLAELQNGIRIINVSEDLRCILLECKDEAGRNHELSVELPSDFPVGCPLFTCDLPEDFDPGWNAQSKSSSIGLERTVHKFQNALHSYQPLWNQLDDLDKNTWVLEPSLPARRSCIERRIAIRSGLSICFTVEASQPRVPPYSMRFVGASEDLSELRRRYNQYIVGSLEEAKSPSSLDKQQGCSLLRWRDDLSLLENFTICFRSLPSPKNSEKSEYVVECGICYTHRLPTEDQQDIQDSDGNGKNSSPEQTYSLPDASCANTNCARSYHEICLFQWLHSLTSARMSFDRVFGTCPYCCESISVKVKNGGGAG